LFLFRAANGDIAVWVTFAAGALCHDAPYLDINSGASMNALPNERRRLLLSLAVTTLAGSQLGGTQPACAQASSLARGGAFGPERQIEAGPLSVAYVEMGPTDGKPVLLLHGWPYDIHAFAEVAPQLASAGYRVVVPHLRGFGATRFLAAGTLRNGQPAALAADIVDLMDALRIPKALLGGFDWGARTANIIAALHPERCKAMVSVSGYLIGSQEAGRMPLPPESELAWWYQFYFATERGCLGYDKNRNSFAKLIWRLASPKWTFDDATFDQSVRAFDNPDHVAVVIHNYRWRLGLAEGEARFDATEQRLAATPTIGVPTITLEGDANSAPHPDPVSYASKFTGPYAHRLVTGGIGHNLPQEAPDAFVNAVLDADRF
jgi:pimeloyl-ACP methyl ester carboxylesterase